MIWFLPFLAISQALSPMCIICHSGFKLPTFFMYHSSSLSLCLCICTFYRDFSWSYKLQLKQFPLTSLPSTFPPSLHGARCHTSTTALCILNYNSLFTYLLCDTMGSLRIGSECAYHYILG